MLSFSVDVLEFLLKCRVIVDMCLLSTTVCSSLVILILEFSITKGDTLPFPARKLPTVLLPILISKSVLLPYNIFLCSGIVSHNLFIVVSQVSAYFWVSTQVPISNGECPLQISTLAMSMFSTFACRVHPNHLCILIIPS